MTSALPRYGRAAAPGAPAPRSRPVGLSSRAVTEVGPSPIPPDFERAIRSLAAGTLRPEVLVAETRAPRRLAPWSYALALDVLQDRDVIGTGRLVLLHDPDGFAAWQGTLRLVGYASVDLDPETGRDPLLPEVGWSWLVDALAASGAAHVAAGGTVTSTTSTRFGELTPHPVSCQLELRASWTPVGTDLAAHLRGWTDLLCTAAGLPPPGVAVLPGAG